MIDWLKAAAYASTCLPKIQSSVKEIKRLIGKGSINFKVETDKELTIRIIVENPTNELEQIAEGMLAILPTINIPGILVVIDIRKDNRKLLKEYRQA